MKTIGFLVALSLSVTEPLHAQTHLLPGMTYFEGPEELSGKLVFLFRHDSEQEINDETAATIYEFDLSLRKLRKLSDTPYGLLVPSKVGDVFCVVYRPGNWYHSIDTNVFLLVAPDNQKRILNLESPPKNTVITDQQMFFVVEATNGTRLLNYDIGHEQRRWVELPDASKWQHQVYDRIHAPKGHSEILHFYYSGFGKRLGDGKDYRDGYYSLAIPTGEMQWFAELLDDKDDERNVYRTFDGNYVFFDGDSAPISGYKLVSSRWDCRETAYRAPKSQKLKVLKRFSKLSVGSYLLTQISPDGRFALVRSQEPASRKSQVRAGWVNTYYLVDVSTGRTRVLFKDEVVRQTSGSMSVLHWIMSAP